MIPNIFHFIFGLSENFGNKPFSLVHYLAVKSAYDLNKPDKIFFHYQYEPSGEWWEKTKKIAELNKVIAPDEIFGNPLNHVAHKADVMRLRYLQEMGGIYLDLDTISVKPLTKFLNHQFVIGEEANHPSYFFIDKVKTAILMKSFVPFKKDITGLCNAVMMAVSKSEFVSLWLDSYTNFRSKGDGDQNWNEHSVRVPLQLAQANPELLHTVNRFAFHYPIHDAKGIDLLFNKSVRFEKSYIHHLWESMSWEKHLKNLSVDYIKTVDTTYNRIARNFLH